MSMITFSFSDNDIDEGVSTNESVSSDESDTSTASSSETASDSSAGTDGSGTDLDGEDSVSVSGNDVDVTGAVRDALDGLQAELAPSALDGSLAGVSEQTDLLREIEGTLYNIATNSSGQYITSPVLDYMESIVSQHDYDATYVAYSVWYDYNYRQYTYYQLLVSDEDSLVLNGSNVNGTDVDVYTFYPNQTPNYIYSHEGSVNVNLGTGGFAITNLSDSYPSFSDTTSLYSSSVFFLLVGFALFWTFTALIGHVVPRFRRRVRKRRVL